MTLGAAAPTPGQGRQADAPALAVHWVTKPKRRLRKKQRCDTKQALLVQPVLYVWSPRGQQHCMGRYELVHGREANGWPLWRMCCGSYWLYSGRGGGHWCIGAQDVHSENFSCSAGFVLSELPHAGRMPDEVGSWQRWDQNGERHINDPTIRVTSTGWASSEVLYITSSSHPCEVCAGKYELVPGCMANGWPLWKMRGGDFWMYSCKDGCWGIGAKDVRAKGFDCCAGFILSVEPHRGAMPHEVSKWERWDEGLDQFLADPGIRVSGSEPAGCWRLSTGYCGRAICRAAHEGDVPALNSSLAAAADAVAAARVPCEVTENDPLCEAAVEGRARAVARLLLEGCAPSSAAALCRAAKAWSAEATAGEPANNGAEDSGDPSTRFLAETLERCRLRHALARRCRGAASLRGGGGGGAAGRARNPLAALPPDVFENVLDFALPRPSPRVRHPETVSSMMSVMRHVQQNPALREWLPAMRACSPRWHQLVRNWDYLQDEIFRREKSVAELDRELRELSTASSSSAGTVRCVGRSVLDGRCREMLLRGVPWPPREFGPDAVPERLRGLQAWRNSGLGTAGGGRGGGSNFFRALPDVAFQRVLDFLVYRFRRPPGARRMHSLLLAEGTPAFQPATAARASPSVVALT